MWRTFRDYMNRLSTVSLASTGVYRSIYFRYANLQNVNKGHIEKVKLPGAGNMEKAGG